MTQGQDYDFEVSSAARSFAWYEENGYTIDPDISDLIYKNPIIGGLQRIADNFGIYSKFVVGDNGIYFVFGLNASYLLSDKGTFIECRDQVYPIQYYIWYGAYSTEGFLLRDWNSICVSGPFSMFDLDQLSNSFRNLEVIADRYALYDMPVPEAMCMTDETLAPIYDCIKMTDNPGKYNKQGWHVLLKSLLEDIAAWEWPIRPYNKRKCGFSAFAESGYLPCGNADIMKQVYDNVDLWDEYFHLEKTSSAAVNLHNDQESAFVLDCLEKMHIPFNDISQRAASASEFLTKAHNRVYRIGKGPQEKSKTNRLRQIIVLPRDVAIVNLLRQKFTCMQFSEEEQAFGNLGGINDSLGKFVFYMPYRYLADFRNHAIKCHFVFGHPSNPNLNLVPFYEGVNLIMDLVNMPLVEDFLHSMYNNSFTGHGVSLDHLSEREQRTPMIFGEDKLSDEVCREKKAFSVKKNKWYETEMKNRLAKSDETDNAVLETSAPDPIVVISAKDYEKRGKYVCSSKLLSQKSATSADASLVLMHSNDLLSK